MIETKNVTKVYKNGFQAVTDLNLKIEKGDIFGFLGPNGAGKTTTIRMLDGLLELLWSSFFVTPVSNNFVFHNVLQKKSCWSKLSKTLCAVPL